MSLRLRGPRPASAYLVAVPHEGTPRVLGPQEAVDQHGPAHGEVEADVLLEVAAELVAGQVVAEAEALAGDQLIHLLPHRGRQQGLQTLWGQGGRGLSSWEGNGQLGIKLNVLISLIYQAVDIVHR